MDSDYILGEKKKINHNENGQTQAASKPVEPTALELLRT